jgi:hypothetical protein
MSKSHYSARKQSWPQAVAKLNEQYIQVRHQKHHLPSNPNNKTATGLPSRISSAQPMGVSLILTEALFLFPSTDFAVSNRHCHSE